MTPAMGVDLLLWVFLAILAVVALRLADLYSATFVLGAYSLVMCLVWTRLNGVDVAFTEASVGAGASGVLIMAAIHLTASEEKKREEGSRLLQKLVVGVVLLLLIYGTTGLPDYADPAAPIHHHVSPRYMSHDILHEAGVPNMVTTILAYYRGYDTMGETTVVFTAGASVLLLLRRKKKASA